MSVVDLRRFKALSVVIGLLVVVACYGGNSSQPVSDDSAFARQGLTEGVSGRVVSESSVDPIAGAAVTAKSLDDPPLAIPELGIDTDRDGGFEWPLHSGKYAITVRAEGYKPAIQEVRFGKGEVVTLEYFLKDQ